MGNSVKHRWGNVIEDREKKPEVQVSFARGDERAMSIVSRWLGVTVDKLRRVARRSTD